MNLKGSFSGNYFYADIYCICFPVITCFAGIFNECNEFFRNFEGPYMYDSIIYPNVDRKVVFKYLFN